MNRLGILLAGLVFPLLALGQASPGNYVAHLTGDAEAPMRDTNATGQAVLHVVGGGALLSYRLIVANIDNVVASHIHLGPAGSNGPVVAFLFGAVPAGGGRIEGVIAEGFVSGADLVGPLAGQSLSVLIEALATGGAYVNVHTNDGIAPTNTGPGDFPGGEIRGQIQLAGPR